MRPPTTSHASAWSRAIAGLVLAIAFCTSLACRSTDSARTLVEHPPVRALAERPAGLAVALDANVQTFNVGWLLTDGDGKPRAGIRVPAFSDENWACAFYPPTSAYPALSVHVWKAKRAGVGEDRAIISTNACWTPPASDFVKPTPDGLGEPRSMVVARKHAGVWTIASPRGPPFTKVGYATLYGNAWDAGEVSGWEIFLHPPDDGADLEALVDCIAARMPVAAWDTRTGLPLTRAELGTWFEYRLDRGDGDIQNLPHFLRKPVLDARAWAVRAHDQYHGARAFMRPLGKYRADHDPIARALISLYAADAMNAYTLGDVPKWSEQWTPFSLRRDIDAALANPGKGGRIVRGEAWTLRLLVAALEVGAPNRAELEAHVAALLRYIRAVQMPSGAFYDARFGAGLDQDEPWLNPLLLLAKNKGECPSWQVPFLVRAVWEAQKQLPSQRELCIAIVLDAEKLWGPRTPRVDGEDGAPAGLPRYLVTSIDGTPVAEITEGVGPARPYYDSDAFECFAEARAARASTVRRAPRRGRVFTFPRRRLVA